MHTGFSVLTASILAALTATFAPIGPVFGFLLALVVLDVATGFLSAYVHKAVSSLVTWPGMSKKAIELLLVLTARVLELTIPYLSPGIPFAGHIAQAVAGFYVIHELLSIVENVGLAGVPLPSRLTAVLAILNETPIAQAADEVAAAIDAPAPTTAAPEAAH